MTDIPPANQEPEVTDSSDESPEQWDLFIDWGIRGSDELRSLIAIDEEMFVRIAGQAVGDSRGYVLYAALDEVQKAAMHIMRLQELLGGTEVSPSTDRPSRLVVTSILEETGARERRLIEVLINLILFSTSNEQAYYRHFLMLEELEDMLYANEDLDSFQGARSVNLDTSIDWQVASIIKHQANVDFANTWYLEQEAKPIPEGVDRKRLRTHIRSSNVRSRIKIALPLMTPSEKLCSGVTYAEAYGRPSEAVHFSANAKAFRLQAGQDSASVTKIGLLMAAILGRVARLLDRTDTPIVGQLIRVHDQSNKENALELIESLTKRGFEVGDFIVAYGHHLAEIIEVRESEYGNRSYYVRYLAEKPLPDVDQDWFPARYVQRLYTRTQAIEGLERLGARHNWSAELLDHMLNGPLENLQDALRQSIIGLWPLLRASLRQQPKPDPNNQEQ